MSWSQEVKNKARKLRLQGSSFGEIKKLLGIPKSTLHTWVIDIPRPAHLQYTKGAEWLKKIRLLASAAIKRKRNLEIQIIIDEVKQEVHSWNFLNSKQIQKAFLSLLYWAEGQKLPERGAPVKFANTDPRLVLLFVTLLKNCYDIDPKKIKIRLYIHWYHNEKLVKEYWKRLLNLDEKQIYKMYRKKRSKTKRFRKNFMGICFVTYQSVDLRQRIIHTAYQIQNLLIENKQKSVPVA